MVQRLKQLHLYGIYALFIYMPFSLFISRWLSLYTGGLGQWDASKDVLTLVLLVTSVYIALKLRYFSIFKIKLLFSIFAIYGLLHLSYLVFDAKDQDTRSWIVATLYNGRFLAYLFVAIILGKTYKNLLNKKLLKILILISTITCIIAFIQYLLPKDIMTYFGYSIERGVKPNFFIDDKVDFPRVMSTIRDPNSYGAYLLFSVTLLWVMLLKRIWSRRKVAVLLIVHSIALFLTFSRGAWIGTLISLLIATVMLVRHQALNYWNMHKIKVLLALIPLLFFGFVFRNTYIVQNVVLHSDESTVMADPNELRLQLQDKAIKDIINDPEGHGPGTAGLVSIGNPNGTFLTENYYLQIGYEIGVLGLILYLTILTIVILYINKNQNELYKVILLASLGGYLFISLLIHLWSNEAVAAQWWIIAGVLIGNSLRNSHNNHIQDN